MKCALKAVCLFVQLQLLWTNPVNADDVTTELPDPIEELAVADSGKYFVIKCVNKATLHIYDPAKAEYAGKVETQSADCVFGAGGTTLVFFRPNDSVLESWDLKTLKRRESVNFVDPGPILRIVMGHANGDEFFLRATSGSGALDRTALQIMDAKTLRPISRQFVGTGGHNQSYRDFVHYRADRA